MKRSILFVSLIVVGFSCGRTKGKNIKENNGHNLIKSYYESGELMSLTEVLNDSINDGEYKEFFKDGTLKLVVNFENGVKQGQYKEFFPSGKLKTEHNNINGGVYGGVYWYHQEGYLNFYSFYDYEEDLIYRVQYDKDGNIIKEEGDVFQDAIINIGEIRTGDTLRAQIFTATPPHSNPVLFVGELDASGNFLNKEASKVELIDGVALFKKSFHKIQDNDSNFNLGLLLEMNSEDENANEFYFRHLKIPITGND